MKYHDLGGTLDLPAMVEIEPTETCNLRCRMCHVSFMSPAKRPMLAVEVLRKLGGMRGRYAIVAAGFEATMHPDFDDLVRILTDLEMPFELTTNATLLDAPRIATLASSPISMFTFSFDGIRKQTFEHIRRNADYQETLENILATRRAFSGRDTFFTVNSTLMRCNLDETIETIDVWDQHDFDMVRFLIMVIREMEPELIRESLYPIRDEVRRVFEAAAEHVIAEKKRIAVRFAALKDSPQAQALPHNFVEDVVRSDNPRTRLAPRPRHDFQLGSFPGMSFPCRSPFTSMRMLANGDVQLCYQFTVGNLHQSSLEEIWFGQEADQVRKTVMTNEKICRSCDYYRFCLGSAALEIEDRNNHLRGDLLSYAEHIDFDTGSVRVPPSRMPDPRLVESYKAYNIVYYAGRYIGVPLAAGPMDLRTTDVSLVSGVVFADTLETARINIRAQRHPD